MKKWLLTSDALFHLFEVMTSGLTILLVGESASSN
jgi:hypothetical protein